MARPPGYILYEGPSLIDGSPIVVIINKIFSKSKNVKTGNAIQTWIIRSDMPPLEAVQNGHDAAVCGTCPARGQWCYVQVGREVTSVYKAYKRGSYQPWEPEHVDLVAGRYVRFGSYGDPAAVPLQHWRPILETCAMHTAYTHQWRSVDIEDWGWCMASCDTLAERDAAKAEGWRCFVTVLPEDVKPPAKRRGIASCPASDEQGKKLTCEECGHCGGTYDRGATRIGDVMIMAHGPLASRYRKWRQLELELEEAA
jgi:hypothetical protein